MLTNTARMIGTVGIWISFAITMAFGLCRMTFGGEFGALYFVLAVGVVSLAAAVGTWIIWRQTGSNENLLK